MCEHRVTQDNFAEWAYPCFISKAARTCSEVIVVTQIILRRKTSVLTVNLFYRYRSVTKYDLVQL